MAGKTMRPFVQPTEAEVAARNHAAELGMGGAVTKDMEVDNADAEEEEDEKNKMRTKGYEQKAPSVEMMGRFRHNIEVKLGRRHMTCCWLLSLPMIGSTIWFAFLAITNATFLVPYALPVAHEEFLGFNVLYNTQEKPVLIEDYGIAFALVLPLYIAVVVSIGASVWRFRRIQLRDTDIRLWTPRDTKTAMWKASRFIVAVIALGLWQGIVLPSESTRIRNDTFWHGCPVVPIYTATIINDYSGSAAPREIDGNRVDKSCQRSYYNSVGPDEHTFRGSVPDNGSISQGFGDNGTLWVWSPPVGRSRFCSKVRDYRGQTLSTMELRQCRDGEGWDISNWATLSDTCDPGYYSRWYEGTLRLGDTPHFVEQWFCDLDMQDLTTKIRVSYETTSWRRPITGSCYDPTRGDPLWLSNLRPGAREVQPDIIYGSVQDLDTASVAALFGQPSYSELDDCAHIGVACINDSRTPTEVGIDGRPTPRFWRSVSLHNCSRDIQRSASIKTDQKNQDYFIYNIQQTYASAVISILCEVTWDFLESIFWPCFF